MLLEIISPDKTVYSGEVTLVQLPGRLSSFEILKNHAPIISTLKKGTVRIIEAGGEERVFTIPGGVVENKDNHVVVLADGR
jgi:F-type H+-transporting ATPase subunit epsilon